jgi:hypothetical protein
VRTCAGSPARKYILPPFLFISRWIVQFCTIQRLIKRNGGSISLGHDGLENDKKKLTSDHAYIRARTWWLWLYVM